MAEQEKVPPHLQQWKDEQFSLPGSRGSVPYETWMRSKGEFEQEGDIFGGVPGNMSNPLLAAWRGFTDTTKWRQKQLEEKESKRRYHDYLRDRGRILGTYEHPQFEKIPGFTFKRLAELNRVVEPYKRWAQEPGMRQDADAAMKGGASQMSPEQVQWTQEVTKNRERDKLRNQQISTAGGASQMAPEQLAQIQMNMSPLVSQMRPEQLAQVQKQQEMMDQFRQMLEARRRAGMGPLTQGGY